MIYNIYIEGKYVVKNLNTVPDTVGIPSFVVCLNPNVQERVGCAQMVRFCQVETEAEFLNRYKREEHLGQHRS